jgi:hypothetical protein
MSIVKRLVTLWLKRIKSSNRLLARQIIKSDIYRKGEKGKLASRS